MRAKEIKRLVGALLTLCMLMTATPQIVLADTEYGDEARRNSEVIRLPLNIDIAESTEFQVAEQDGEIAQSSSDEAVTLANDTYSDWEEAGEAAVQGEDYSIDNDGNYRIYTAKGLAKIANLVNSGQEQFLAKTVFWRMILT